MDSILKRCLGFLLVPQIMLAQPRFTDVTNQAGIDHHFKVFGGSLAELLQCWTMISMALKMFITGGNGNNHLYKTMVMVHLKMSHGLLVWKCLIA